MGTLTLAEASRVNREVNSRGRYVTDLEQYGVPDYWGPIGETWKGDCEDYALEKRQRLGAGQLTICRTETGEGHMVLYVETSDAGGVILDNRYPEPRFPGELPYTWVVMLEGGKWREVTGFS